MISPRQCFVIEVHGLLRLLGHLLALCGAGVSGSPNSEEDERAKNCRKMTLHLDDPFTG